MTDGVTARILIVDDHELARSGLRAMLAGHPGIEVAGEAGGGREALALCRGVRPDLVLMDVRMSDMDGLEATRAIKAEHPEISVIIVTMHEDPDYLLEAVKAGAAGFLVKDATERELVGAVRRVLQGESLLDSRLAAQLLHRLTRDSSPGGRLVEKLSPREMEVLVLVAQGLTNKEIGARLYVSPGTVKLHVQHIIGKLGVSDRTQAAVQAIQLGLIQPVPV